MKDWRSYRHDSYQLPWQRVSDVRKPGIWDVFLVSRCKRSHVFGRRAPIAVQKSGTDTRSWHRNCVYTCGLIIQCWGTDCWAGNINYTNIIARPVALMCCKSLNLTDEVTVFSPLQHYLSVLTRSQNVSQYKLTHQRILEMIFNYRSRQSCQSTYPYINISCTSTLRPDYAWYCNGCVVCVGWGGIRW